MITFSTVITCVQIFIDRPYYKAVQCSAVSAVAGWTETSNLTCITKRSNFIYLSTSLFCRSNYPPKSIQSVSIGYINQLAQLINTRWFLRSCLNNLLVKSAVICSISESQAFRLLKFPSKFATNFFFNQNINISECSILVPLWKANRRIAMLIGWGTKIHQPLQEVVCNSLKDTPSSPNLFIILPISICTMQVTRNNCGTIKTDLFCHMSLNSWLHKFNKV